MHGCVFIIVILVSSSFVVGSRTSCQIQHRFHWAPIWSPSVCFVFFGDDFVCTFSRPITVSSAYQDADSLLLVGNVHENEPDEPFFRSFWSCSLSCDVPCLSPPPTSYQRLHCGPTLVVTLVLQSEPVPGKYIIQLRVDLIAEVLGAHTYRCLAPGDLVISR